MGSGPCEPGYAFPALLLPGQRVEYEQSPLRIPARLEVALR